MFLPRPPVRPALSPIAGARSTRFDENGLSIVATRPKLSLQPRAHGVWGLWPHYYNHMRPHRALKGSTPLQAYSAGLKARSVGASAQTHFRVRQDQVDAQGKVSLRYMSRLHHIGLGTAHKGRAVKLLVADQNVRVIDLNGELIRELTLDPSRDYQPLGCT